MSEPETTAESKSSTHPDIKSDAKSPSVDWEQLMAERERPELYYRRPGRFRRWEIGDVIDRNADFRVMEDGMTSDKTRLYAIYRRDPEQHEQLQMVLNLADRGRTPPDGPVSPAPSAPTTTSVVSSSSVEPGAIAVPLTRMLEDPIADRQLVRMPGLFVRWELALLLEPLEPGAEYHIEPAGTLMDGSDLFAVFQKKRAVRHDGG